MNSKLICSYTNLTYKMGHIFTWHFSTISLPHAPWILLYLILTIDVISKEFWLHKSLYICLWYYSKLRLLYFKWIQVPTRICYAFSKYFFFLFNLCSLFWVIALSLIVLCFNQYNKFHLNFRLNITYCLDSYFKKKVQKIIKWFFQCLISVKYYVLMCNILFKSLPEKIISYNFKHSRHTGHYSYCDI